MENQIEIPDGEVKKENYVFGDYFGRMMAKTTPKFQLESSMMSLLFLMIGVGLTSIYIVFWTDFSLFFRIMTGVNGFFGVMLLYSQLVGFFQAYQSLCEIQSVQDLLSSAVGDVNNVLKGGNENGEEKI